MIATVHGGTRRIADAKPESHPCATHVVHGKMALYQRKCHHQQKFAERRLYLQVCRILSKMADGNFSFCGGSRTVQLCKLSSVRCDVPEMRLAKTFETLGSTLKLAAEHVTPCRDQRQNSRITRSRRGDWVSFGPGK